jgi:hypothetical protein
MALEIDQMRATLDKTEAETRKILREAVIAPFMVGVAVTGGLAALISAIFGGILLLVTH